MYYISLQGRNKILVYFIMNHKLFYWETPDSKTWDGDSVTKQEGTKKYSTQIAIQLNNNWESSISCSEMCATYQ